MTERLPRHLLVGSEILSAAFIRERSMSHSWFNSYRDRALEAGIEVFEHDGARVSDDDCWVDEDGNLLPAGWYWWSCQPGCLPGDPIGPFKTENEAYRDALEGLE